MTVNERRLDELALVANGRINGNHRRIDHSAVERAAANLWDVNDQIRRLISERVAVDDRRLADSDVPIDQLVASERGGVA